VMLDVQAALDEIVNKSESQIQIETAHKWAARAIACYMLYGKTQHIGWLTRAEEYRHEAIEHAAVAEDGCYTLKKLDRQMKEEAFRVGIF